MATRTRVAALVAVALSMTAAVGASLIHSADEPSRFTRVDRTDREDTASPPDVTTTSTTSTSVATTTTTIPTRAQPALRPPTSPGPLDGMLIVVDPGHNGRNFEYATVLRPNTNSLCNSVGATAANGTTEVDINWDIATQVTMMLTALGAAVLVTHEDNEGFGPCADERGALARDHQAAALVSIHADGSTTGGQGFHLIHPLSHANLSAETVSQSQVLATEVRNELVAVGGRPATYVGSGGLHGRDDLANLNTANRPAVLAELGNLRNRFDAQLLSETGPRKVIAAAIVRGLLRYFGRPVDSLAVRGDLNLDGVPDPLPDYSTTTTTSTTTTIPPVLSLPDPQPDPLPAPPASSTPSAAPPASSSTTSTTAP